MSRLRIIIASLFGILLPVFLLGGEAYQRPTGRYIEYNTWEAIVKGLESSGLTLEHRPLFDSIGQSEERGLIGYHASSQEFRIYQDVIKIVLEELLGLKIKEDFHFFRIPGESLYNHENLGSYGPNPLDPTLFLSVNFALYGNHEPNAQSSSSYLYFAKNCSAHKIDFEEKIRPLFERLSIDLSHIGNLFTIGRRELTGAHGVLFQLIDTSDEPYALADNHALCHECSTNFSTALDTKGPLPQEMSLLLTNKFTLNPYSSLVVKRFDYTDPEQESGYLNKMRQAVRSLTFGQLEATLYRQQLLRTWGIARKVTKRDNLTLSKENVNGQPFFRAAQREDRNVKERGALQRGEGDHLAPAVAHQTPKWYGGPQLLCQQLLRTGQ